jgi:hypothetical protein
MSGRGSLRVPVLCVLSWTGGCGVPRDAQVPLVPDRDPVTLPTFAQVPAQAFASIEVQSSEGASTKSCPVSLGLALGSSCDRITSAEGTCGAVRNGEDGVVDCAIRPRTDAPSIYDVDVLLGHALLPRLGVIGPMSDANALSVRVQLTAPDGVTLDTECLAEAIVVQPGMVRFGLLNCVGNVDGQAGSQCQVRLSAGFENCTR